MDRAAVEIGKAPVRASAARVRAMESGAAAAQGERTLLDATVRERLLDWVGAAIEASIPEAKARMIRLESRQAAAEAAPTPVPGTVQIVPVFVLQMPDQKPIVLCQQPELISALEKQEGLGSLLQQNAQFDAGNFRLVPRNATQYPNARSLYEYSAVKLTPGAR